VERRGKISGKKKKKKKKQPVGGNKKKKKKKEKVPEGKAPGDAFSWLRGSEERSS